MPNLSCEISRSLINALQARVRATGEPLDHLVMLALADYLEVPHATLFQVSTSGALVEGISQGVVTVGELKRHGDLGLGTYADLDGEMVVVDGRFWRVPGVGAIREAADSDLAPFAVVTSFRPERSIELASVASIDDLLGQLDRLRNSNNLFFAARSMAASAAYTRAQFARSGSEAGRCGGLPGGVRASGRRGNDRRFLDARVRQEREHRGLAFAFFNNYDSSRGHVHELAGSGLHTHVQHLDDFRMAIPESPEFPKAHLKHDQPRP